MRITVEVTDTNPVHSRLSVWVNGGLITAPGGICLRNEEVDPFVSRLANDPADLLPALRTFYANLRASVKVDSDLPLTRITVTWPVLDNDAALLELAEVKGGDADAGQDQRLGPNTASVNGAGVPGAMSPGQATSAGSAPASSLPHVEATAPSGRILFAAESVLAAHEGRQAAEPAERPTNCSFCNHCLDGGCVHYWHKVAHSQFQNARRETILEAACNLREWAIEIDSQWHNEAWVKAGTIRECAERIESMATNLECAVGGPAAKVGTDVPPPQPAKEAPSAPIAREVHGETTAGTEHEARPTTVQRPWTREEEQRALDEHLEWHRRVGDIDPEAAEKLRKANPHLSGLLFPGLLGHP